MMGYKPGDGYNGRGYIDPKKRARIIMILLVVFFIGLFWLTAIVLGWWSILLDIGIIVFVTWLGKEAEAANRKA